MLQGETISLSLGQGTHSPGPPFPGHYGNRREQAHGQGLKVSVSGTFSSTFIMDHRHGLLTRGPSRRDSEGEA